VAAQRRSRLVPLGFVLMVVGVAFPRALSTVVRGMEPGAGRSAVTGLIVLLFAGFLAGLVMAVMGILRNRRMYRS
jgi:hypothetical protein